MQVSILAAFVAGVISFLSPCVLPLVPGYISMLSGIGVEQLRQGETPRGNLLASSFAFVMGFAVVFVAFGASASAVGQFLLHNKSLLAPFAGAIIVLFGLHLIGVLSRIPVRAGLIVGALLAATGLVIWRRLDPGPVTPAQLISVSLIFLAGPMLTRWLNRDVHFRNLGSRTDQDRKAGPFAGVTERLFAWLRVRVWLDAVHWPNPRRGTGHGCDERNGIAWRLHAGRILRRSGDPVFAHSARASISSWVSTNGSADTCTRSRSVAACCCSPWAA